MTRQKKTVFKLLFLALVWALILRPLVVCAQNSQLHKVFQRTTKESGSDGKNAPRLTCGGHFLNKIPKNISQKKFFAAGYSRLDFLKLSPAPPEFNTASLGGSFRVYTILRI